MTVKYEDIPISVAWSLSQTLVLPHDKDLEGHQVAPYHSQVVPLHRSVHQVAYHQPLTTKVVHAS